MGFEYRWNHLSCISNIFQASFAYYQWNHLPKWTMVLKIMIKKHIGLIQNPLKNSKRSYQPYQKEKQSAWVFDLYQYEGFWSGSFMLEGMLSAQDHFKPQPNHVSWVVPQNLAQRLKALTFAIMTRSHVGESTNPLFMRIAHDCIPFIEVELPSSPQ